MALASLTFKEIKARPLICKLTLPITSPSAATGAKRLFFGDDDYELYRDLRLDPVSLPMTVDKGDHGLNRRSRSAFA